MLSNRTYCEVARKNICGEIVFSLPSKNPVTNDFLNPASAVQGTHSLHAGQKDDIAETTKL